MKKIYSLLIAAAAAGSITAGAQQLPNNGFENGWAKIKPYIGGSSSTNVAESPADWTISHVAGYKLVIWWTGTTTVGAKISGYNSTNAVQIYNTNNPVVTTQYVPGYITLGTTWNTANTSGNEKDGGTFGGISFTYRPDAISFMYQREQATGSSEQATVVAYMWKGSTSQASVPVNIDNNPTKVTMTNRDRNILGIATAKGGDVTTSNDFERIAKINYAINGSQSEWTNMVIPFDYETTDAPTMINVIFSAGNYFSDSPENGNKMNLDDVKLLYYSRLASLSVNGASVNGFDSNTYSYTIDSEMPAESAFAYTTLGNSGSAKASISLDEDNAIATITVTNSNNGGTDVDGETTHAYTIQFNKPQVVTPPTPAVLEGTKYEGTLSIKLEAIGLDVQQEDAVYIKDNGDGTCKFTLPNFTLTLPESEPANFGDIVVENVTMTKNSDGTISYSGSVNGMSLADGEIIADVELSGTEKDGVLTMDIPVTWDGLTIDVAFNGSIPQASVPEGTKYSGTLAIVLEALGINVSQDDAVYIKDNGDGTCKFTLPNFTLTLPESEPANFGDIVVENVTMTKNADGTISYSGSVSGMSLADGEIIADVELSGTEENGTLSMLIPVTWEGFTINVSFNGQKDSTAGIRDIISGYGDEDAPVEYYNLNGVRVNGENITPGIYIRRQGSDVKKILVK